MVGAFVVIIWRIVDVVAGVFFVVVVVVLAVDGCKIFLHGQNIDKRNSCSVLSGVLWSVRRNRTSALFFEIKAERIVYCRISSSAHLSDFVDSPMIRFLVSCCC